MEIANRKMDEMDGFSSVLRDTAAETSDQWVVDFGDHEKDEMDETWISSFKIRVLNLFRVSDSRIWNFLGQSVIEELEVLDGVFVVEDGGSGDDEVGLHGCDLGDGVFVNASIDADEELGFPGEEGFDFYGEVVEEGFLAAVWADSEEEDVVDLIEVFFDEADGGSGVEGDAADDVLVAGNTSKGVVDVGSVFGGERDEIGTGFGEGVDVLFGLVDEQVNVFEEFGFKAGDEGGTDGDVGPDVAVHDIEVQEVDVVFLQDLQGGGLVAHVVAEGGDGELGAAADEVDFFCAGHDGSCKLDCRFKGLFEC